MRTVGVREIGNKVFCIEIADGTGKISLVIYDHISRMTYPCEYDMTYARSLRKMKIVEAKNTCA
jgi:hypothetical protein